MVGLSECAWYRPLVDWEERDAPVATALTELVERRPSRGFWKCRKLLRRTRPGWNHKRIYRVYKAMRLNLRRAAKRRLPKRNRVPLYVPERPDMVWSADFMSDALACGKRFRTFNVIDDFNREALHIEIDTSISSARLVRVFEQLQKEHGLPKTLRTDNVPSAESSLVFRQSSPSSSCEAGAGKGGRIDPEGILWWSSSTYSRVLLSIMNTRSASAVLTVPKTA